MKTLSGYVDDAYMTWLTSAVNCCRPLRDESPLRGRGLEKPMLILHDSQPRLIPPPIPEPQESRPHSRSREWVGRTRSFASRASSRGRFSVRRKLNAYNGPRRQPRRTRIGAISAPSDFRHVDNAMPRRTERFRPLELSIYMPENQLSPILPHFGAVDKLSLPTNSPMEPSYPPTAITHSRSESALSFSIPRKPIRSNSKTSSELATQFGRTDSIFSRQFLTSLEKELPKPPVAARLRADTEPPAYERVKSALHERFELEQRLKEIEEIIEERQSVYFSSRPTSRMSASTRRISVYEESVEPMPVINPSFAERVITPPPIPQRPKTAPSKPVHIPNRAKSFTEASAAFTTPPRMERPLPPPPLPLVLQQPHPPLRKKKSFSRVSNWLFPGPGNDHTRNMSLGSVTNSPKPVTSRDGFYQCMDLNAPASKMSVSTVSTLESEIDEPTVPTTWTPDSSPGRGSKMELLIGTVDLRHDTSMESARQDSNLELSRERTSGENGDVRTGETWRLPHGRESVGVAF